MENTDFQQKTTISDDSSDSINYSTESENSYDNDRVIHNKYLVLFLLFVFSSSIYLIYSTKPIHNINNQLYLPVYHRFIYDQPRIDWWERYNNMCCVSNNSTMINNDCRADDKCKDYINYWLMNYNQTFYTSPWIFKCCYEYRFIGSKIL